MENKGDKKEEKTKERKKKIKLILHLSICLKSLTLPSFSVSFFSKDFLRYEKYKFEIVKCDRTVFLYVVVNFQKHFIIEANKRKNRRPSEYKVAFECFRH